MCQNVQKRPYMSKSIQKCPKIVQKHAKSQNISILAKHDEIKQKKIILSPELQSNY